MVFVEIKLEMGAKIGNLEKVKCNDIKEKKNFYCKVAAIVLVWGTVLRKT